MRLIHGITLALAGLVASVPALAQDGRHDWLLELSLDVLDSEAGDKLAPEPENGSSRLAFLYRGDIRPTLSVELALDANSDGSAGIDATEAFLNWRPVPRSRIRHELRTGVFYPPLSLENTRRGWSSPYTTSFSAINTWVAEELRTIGAEWHVSRTIGARQRQREIGFFAAGFYANDPAGGRSSRPCITTTMPTRRR